MSPSTHKLEALASNNTRTLVASANQHSHLINLSVAILQAAITKLQTTTLRTIIIAYALLLILVAAAASTIVGLLDPWVAGIYRTILALDSTIQYSTSTVTATLDYNTLKITRATANQTDFMTPALETFIQNSTDVISTALFETIANSTDNIRLAVNNQTNWVIPMLDTIHIDTLKMVSDLNQMSASSQVTNARLQQILDLLEDFPVLATSWAYNIAYDACGDYIDGRTFGLKSGLLPLVSQGLTTLTGCVSAGGNGIIECAGATTTLLTASVTLNP